MFLQQIKKNIVKSEAGQGLLETVIALSIIITGLVGALALSINNLSSTSDSGLRVIAGNLAREGAEVARNMRDSNWLKGCPDAEDEENCFYWDSGIFNEVDDHTAVARFYKSPINEWRLDFEPDVLSYEQTKLKNDNNLYNHESGEETSFSRLLTIDEICEEGTSNCVGDICGEGESCPEEKRIGLRIFSEVEWVVRGQTKNIIIEDRLYNWK